ncbi:MAG: pyrroloquinoline-quinone synthase PqqC [Saccharopolyspora sp.]|uniref:pyrroloquinoline-quinone synthase PqqC n=1 Tax=Saccharopolyspora TaxID=1835 RepID=UPI00190BF83E|nr:MULTISPECIES: pyrroloquinoline-quinone synthase PqqC [unclassified Saccharopolyspora]MBK0869133.1 pyrroloquinoline-quinone synthase PqqC [Saccharopolyspora sp. HNM0986]MBQ6642905.1 pyrroloquinoline-quinone synthase PqqC [Saccharopolyspora sp.]
MTPLSAADFEDELREVGERRYHHLHPFNERMHAGDLTEQEFRGWVRNRFYYQLNLPIKDAYVLTKLPGSQHRRRWIKRITDHDGTSGNEGGIERWVRLGEAVGLTREELHDTRTVLPGVRFAVDAYVEFCRDRPWLEAVASALTELFAPDLLSRRITDVREHYPWIAPAGLEYFRTRLTQQPADIAHLLELVRDNATTRAQQEACVQALEFKCDVLWTLLDTVQLTFGKDS